MNDQTRELLLAGRPVYKYDLKAAPPPPIINPIPLHLWGSDHWSTLLYLESRFVDHDGYIKMENMRGHITPFGDAAKHPTRLAAIDDDTWEWVKIDLYGHNDFDCARDMTLQHGQFKRVTHPTTRQPTYRVRLDDYLLGWAYKARAYKGKTGLKCHNAWLLGCDTVPILSEMDRYATKRVETLKTPAQTQKAGQ